MAYLIVSLCHCTWLGFLSVCLVIGFMFVISFSLFCNSFFSYVCFKLKFHLWNLIVAMFIWQSDFFITYILSDGLSGFSLEALQLWLLLWHFIKSHTFSRNAKQEPLLFTFPYYRVIPIISLAVLIGMVYAVIAPLLLPFLIVYFVLGYVVWVNQVRFSSISLSIYSLVISFMWHAHFLMGAFLCFLPFPVISCLLLFLVLGWMIWQIL